jgi:hypothetical protein
MWINIVEPGKPHVTTWRRHIACWIPKVTITHSEYVIQFSTATIVARKRLNVTLYVNCCLVDTYVHTHVLFLAIMLPCA